MGNPWPGRGDVSPRSHSTKVAGTHSLHGALLGGGPDSGPLTLQVLRSWPGAGHATSAKDVMRNVSGNAPTALTSCCTFPTHAGGQMAWRRRGCAWNVEPACPGRGEPGLWLTHSYQSEGQSSTITVSGSMSLSKHKDLSLALVSTTLQGPAWPRPVGRERRGLVCPKSCPHPCSQMAWLAIRRTPTLRPLRWARN